MKPNQQLAPVFPKHVLITDESTVKGETMYCVWIVAKNGTAIETGGLTHTVANARKQAAQLVRLFDVPVIDRTKLKGSWRRLVRSRRCSGCKGVIDPAFSVSGVVRQDTGAVVSVCGSCMDEG